ncbi:MAG: Yip1 family protein [Planctomycetota bacterium]|jgi:hypothetical protein
MNCSDCGFWNPPDQRVCGRCGLELPAPIPLGEAAEDPAPARPKRPKVKSEVLELFDPSKQRDRKAPAGTRLIRRRRPHEEDGEDRPDAVPGETAGRDDAPPLPPDPPKRRKRTSRRLTVCTVCTAPFPARELVKLRNKLYCLACLERRENLFDPDELQEAKRDRAARMSAAREREEAAAEANPVRRRGTDTKRLEVQRRHAELASRGEGPSASHTAIIWPKCPRHPGHSTNDRCTKCRAPVCALCISRKGARTLCPGCADTGATGPTPSSRAVASDSSGLDVLKDVLLSPLIFFRTVPGASGAVRPFVMAMLGCFIGSLVLVVQAGIWVAATDQLGPLSLVLNRPVPVVSGAACIALAGVVLPIVLHALLASMLGGQAKFGHSARGSMFAAIPGWLGAIPVGGVVLWPLFHLTASTAMLRQVQQLNWFFAALGALFALAAQVGAGILITQYVFA